MKVVKRVPSNNEMHIVNPPKSDTTAYPLSTFTYVIVPKASPKAGGLGRFIRVYQAGVQTISKLHS